MKLLWIFMMFAMLVWVVYLMDPHVWAAEAEASPKKGNVATRELMEKFLSRMEALKPYIASDEKFSDPKNFAEIDSHLRELSVLAKKAAHDPKLQLPGYRVSQRVLQEHIAETERVFRSGKKPYARWMLNSTLSICMSCHTQTPTVSRGLRDFERPDTFVSPFEQAEFLFATRAFDQAKSIYEKLILNFPESGIKGEQVETALERMMTYHARIMRDPGGAVVALQQYQKNKKLPEYLKADMRSWLKAFKDWKNEPTLDPETASESQIVAFARKNLETDNTGYVVTSDNLRAALYLKVSGILYEYLQRHPASAVTPDVLYWLAICDKGLNNNFFYSLGDIYLKECIVGYPRNPTAKLCYDEYESETIASYSGSGGTNVPEDVKVELNRLRALMIAPPPQGVRR